MLNSMRFVELSPPTKLITPPGGYTAPMINISWPVPDGLVERYIVLKMELKDLYFKKKKVSMVLKNGSVGPTVPPVVLRCLQMQVVGRRLLIQMFTNTLDVY